MVRDPNAGSLPPQTPETIDHDAPPLEDNLQEHYETAHDADDPQQQPPQAFPPPQSHHDQQPSQAFPPPQSNHDQPQPFPPPQSHHDQPPQAFPPPQSHQQAPPHAQNHQPQQQSHDAQAFPPAQGFQEAQFANNQPFNSPMAPGTPFYQPLPTEPWKTELFGCMEDPQNAIVTALFPCVTFGQIAEIIDTGNSSCATSGMMYGCIGFLIAMPCLLSCTYRTKLRARYGLMETPGPDWLVHGLCEWCALCQEYRELKMRGFDPAIGWQGNKERAQMMQLGSMTPPMRQNMMG